MNDKKMNQSREFGKPAWDWTPVQCVLKTTESNRKSVQWQLAPSILLTNPTSNNSDPNVRLFIDTEKSLSYATDLGWNWHKSWNLPNISIRLQIKDQATGEQLLTPKNIYAQIFAVKKNGDNERSEKVVLLDVGIRGDSKMQMVDGQVYFSAMKFSSTTYNNQGQNFHLLIVIYIQENETDKPKVLTAVISPEIFVDSRRSARDYQEKKFNSFVEPFSTDQLDKQFIKRENKSRTEQQIQIKNDPEGFYNYLTAPNIRHKVKHPVFLAIRFSSCVTILFNQDRIGQLISNERQGQTSAVTAREIMELLQKKLLKESQTKNVRQDGIVSAIPEKLFLFVVENISDSLKRKKVMESIETLESQSFGVVEDAKLVPPEFKKLTEFGPLAKIYKDSFELLKELCRRYVPSDEQSSGEQSDEEYGNQSEQVKKIKVNKIQNGNEFTFNNPSAKKPKTANIVCQTIQTVDSKPVPASIAAKNGQEDKNEKPIGQLNSSNRVQKEIKEEEEYHKEPSYKPVIENVNPVGFRPISTGNLQSTTTPGNTVTTPNQASSFSMKIGSQKGSAFNNLRTPEPEKNELIAQQQQQQQQAQFNMGFPGFPQQNSNTNFGLGNLGSLGALGNLGAFGMAQGASGMNGIPGLTGMGGMAGLNPLVGMAGLPGMAGLAGMSGLGNLAGMANMTGMPGQANVNSIPGLSNLGFGMSNFQNMMNPTQMPNLPNMPRNNNPTPFPNFNAGQAQNTMNNQAKSLQNLLCSNLLLSNWLSSVKANNQSLQQSIKGPKSSDEQSQKAKNPQDPMSDLTRFSPQENQSMAYLLQQINLYRELLNQVTYQNELLGRNMNPSQPMNPTGSINQLQEMMQSMQSMQAANNMRLRGFQPTKDGQGQSGQPKEEHQD